MRVSCHSFSPRPARAVALVLVIGMLAVLFIVVFGMSARAVHERRRAGDGEARARLLCEERSAILRAARRWALDGRPSRLAMEVPLTSTMADEATTGVADGDRGKAVVTIVGANASDGDYGRLGVAPVAGDAWLRVEVSGGKGAQTVGRLEATYLLRGGDVGRRVLVAERFLD